MNRHLRRLLTTTLPPQVIQRWGGFQAVRTFRQAAASVPAYRDFLARLQVPVGKVWAYRDFVRHVPVCDEHSYLRQYPLEMLCHSGDFHGKHVMEPSSNHHGTPFFRPRARGEDRQLRDHVEGTFRDLLQAHRMPTLVLAPCPPGTQAAGRKLARAVSRLGEAGQLKVSVVSPDIDLDQAIETLRRFLPRFDQTVIAGPPPFLKDLIAQGGAHGLHWPDHRVHLITGGQTFPENWREFMAEALGIEQINQRGGGQIIAGYDSGDTGIEAAGETPLAVLIRRLAWGNRRLCRDLFAGQWPAPHVFQYQPTRLLAEEVGGELVFTSRAALPLVRYNVHQPGGTISFDRATEVLRAHGYNHTALLRGLGWPPQTHYRLPLFYVSGPVAATTAQSQRPPAALPLRRVLTPAPAWL